MRNRILFICALVGHTTSSLKISTQQAGLQNLFPTWAKVMRNQEVIKFAFGLSDDKATVREFVYETLVTHLREQIELPRDVLDPEAEFLRSLLQEDPGNATDPLHNKYLNYIAKNDDKIIIPSQVYVIASGEHDMRRIQRYTGGTQTEETPGVCLMKLDSDNLSQATKVLGHIQDQHHGVKLTFLDWNRLKLSKRDWSEIRHALQLSAEIITVCIWSSDLNLKVYRHLATQLDESCSKLRKLDLGELKDKEIIEQIRKIVESTTSLHQFHLYKCEIPDKTFKETVTQLPSHAQLHTLQLDRTQNVPAELGAALEKMKNLRRALFEKCNMNENSSGAVLKGLSACHDLEDLKMTANVLTGVLDQLFGDSDHPGFEKLETFWINRTKLSSEDIDVLVQVVRDNKLPNLQNFDISINSTLFQKYILSDLLQGEHGLPHLMRLSIGDAHLRACDVRSCSYAIWKGKLPKLRHLSLFGSRRLRQELGQERLADLVRYAIKQYESREEGFVVNLRECKLTEEMAKPLEDLCSGTNVYIYWRKPGQDKPNDTTASVDSTEKLSTDPHTAENTGTPEQTEEN